MPAFKDPSNTPETTTEDPEMSGATTKETTDLAEREAELARREAAVKAQEEANAKAATEARDAAAVSFADGLVKDGKLAPAGKDVIVAVHKRLANSDEPIAFADGTSKPALASFEELLTGATPIINLGEVTKDDGARTLDANPTVAQLEVRAREIQKENPAIQFSEAVRQAEEEAKQ